MVFRRAAILSVSLAHVRPFALSTRAVFYFVFCRRRQIVSYKVSLYKWEKTVIFSQLRGQVGKKSRFFPVELFGISEQLVTLLFRGKVCIYLTKKSSIST